MENCAAICRLGQNLHDVLSKISEVQNSMCHMRLCQSAGGVDKNLCCVYFYVH